METQHSSQVFSDNGVWDKWTNSEIGLFIAIQEAGLGFWKEIQYVQQMGFHLSFPCFLLSKPPEILSQGSEVFFLKLRTRKAVRAIWKHCEKRKSSSLKNVLCWKLDVQYFYRSLYQPDHLNPGHVQDPENGSYHPRTWLQHSCPHPYDLWPKAWHHFPLVNVCLYLLVAAFTYWWNTNSTVPNIFVHACTWYKMHSHPEGPWGRKNSISSNKQ